MISPRAWQAWTLSHTSVYSNDQYFVLVTIALSMLACIYRLLHQTSRALAAMCLLRKIIHQIPSLPPSRLVDLQVASGTTSPMRFPCRSCIPSLVLSRLKESPIDILWTRRARLTVQQLHHRLS